MDEKVHALHLLQRNKLSIEGVEAVDTTTEQKISLTTNMGDMVVLGQGLHICHLDLDAQKAVFGGRITSLSYPEKVLRGKDKRREKQKRTPLFKG